jgi:hypothetical protein
LGVQVLQELRTLLRQDKISFAALGNSEGETIERGSIIRINENLRNTRSFGKLALTLIHECAHLIRPWEYLIEEILCRNFEGCFYADLVDGLTFRASPSIWGQQSSTVRLTRQDDQESYRFYELYFLRNRVVDHVLNLDVSITDPTRGEYLRHLTPEFIRQTFSWWGGIGHREAQTRGHYVRVLSYVGTYRHSDAELVVQILESLPQGNRNAWINFSDKVTRHGWDCVRLLMSSPVVNRDAQLTQRVRALESRLNMPRQQNLWVNFGSGSDPRL